MSKHTNQVDVNDRAPKASLEIKQSNRMFSPPSCNQKKIKQPGEKNPAFNKQFLFLGVKMESTLKEIKGFYDARIEKLSVKRQPDMQASPIAGTTNVNFQVENKGTCQVKALVKKLKESRDGKIESLGEIHAISKEILSGNLKIHHGLLKIQRIAEKNNFSAIKGCVDRCIYTVTKDELYQEVQPQNQISASLQV